MKKITSLFVVVSMIVLTVSSCKKDEDTTVTKTINVELSPNQSYSATVPAGDADDVMQITSQAQHSSVSSITLDPSTGSNVFKYTPTLNYEGTDDVQITNAEGEHHGGGHSHGGMCSGHHHNDNTVYDYRISIKGQNTAMKKNTKVTGLICPSF